MKNDSRLAFLLKIQPGSIFKLCLSPAVKLVDRIFRTNLANCDACGCRELKWNRGWKSFVLKMIDKTG